MRTPHPAERVGSLLEAVWTASALARVIMRGIDTELADDDPTVPLLESAGLLERGNSGFVIVGREELRGREAGVVANIRSCLGQAFDISCATPGWSSHGDEVLQAQGEASALGAQGFANLISFLPGLADAFADGGVLLDVGVGVAALACAFCDVVPRARVIGLDVEPRALALARIRVRERHLDERVDLRQVGIENFDDPAVADLAHMSPVFIPPTVLAPAMKRVRSALKPGGWLVLSGVVREEADHATRWMAHQAGGSAVTETDAAKLAIDAGFHDPVQPPPAPGAPRLLLLRAAPFDVEGGRT